MQIFLGENYPGENCVVGTFPSTIRQYNNSIRRNDLCDQYITAYRLDRRSKCRFYLSIFFDLMPLMDVALVNSFIEYDKFVCRQVFILGVQSKVSQHMIDSFRGSIREFPSS